MKKQKNERILRPSCVLLKPLISQLCLYLLVGCTSLTNFHFTRIINFVNTCEIKVKFTWQQLLPVAGGVLNPIGHAVSENRGQIAYSK